MAKETKKETNKEVIKTIFWFALVIISWYIALNYHIVFVPRNQQPSSQAPATNQAQKKSTRRTGNNWSA
ncbi:MAG TPA: hypothetical protein GX502_08050 [Syntrophaceticus sp.]|nr:hypothetical protein [Syntrophaceticus sp.]